MVHRCARELAGEQALIGYGGSGLEQADYAARLDSVDWGIPHQFKADEFNLLLPDVQSTPPAGRGTQGASPWRIAARISTPPAALCKRCSRMASAFDQHPTLSGQLVELRLPT